MEIICSPRGIVDIHHPGQGIIDIARAGFQNILLDFSIACPEYEFEMTGKKQKNIPQKQLRVTENPEELYNSLKTMLDKGYQEKLSMPIACAPHLCRDTKRADLGNLLIRVIEESIEACGKAGCHFLIVRPLFSGVKSGEEWEVNREYYLHLADRAKKHRVTILLENQCRNVNGHLVRGICADSRKAAVWVDRLNEEAGEEVFGFCMDAGVCNLCGQNMQEFIHPLGSRLKAVILRDCDIHRENAMLPFTCVDKSVSRTDWLGLIRGLRENAFDGQLVLDFADTAAAFSPILRSGLIQLAKSVADYFKWQIELESLLKKYPSIVLFGAGNMCRNYMKCYGEKYPPLFTCDNNQTLWGTSFCGLKVKPPASLKELPEDCAIFICNIYYREIEAQLRGMGIRNLIAFFNDEYMPSFYYDRLERDNK